VSYNDRLVIALNNRSYQLHHAAPPQ
jgi:hypothetical protein